MIQQQSKLKVADNTGARIVRCIKVLGGSRRRYAGVGDTIVCSVREAQTRGSAKKGEISKAVIVRTRGRIQRSDGSVLRFYDNSCVLMDEKNNPRGTRVFGPIAREVRERQHLKIASLAPEVW